MPCFPITQRKHVVYLSVINYDYNWEPELMEPSELYVLAIHMKHRGVVSLFKAPSEEYGGIRIIPDLTMAYPSNFTSYLDKVHDYSYFSFLLTNVRSTH